MKRDFSVIVVIGVIAAAALFAFFGAGVPSNAGFATRSSISTPVAYTAADGPYVDCAEIYGPACGGDCAVVVTYPWGNRILEGVCEGIAGGGCACKRTQTPPLEPAKRCACNQPACGFEAGGISATVTYHGGSCSVIGSPCTCSGSTSHPQGYYGGCDLYVHGTCAYAG